MPCRRALGVEISLSVDLHYYLFQTVVRTFLFFGGSSVCVCQAS